MTKGTGRELGAAGRVAFLGMMLALALVLSFVESMIPAIPFLPPGVKLGLSNIVTMYCMLFLGGVQAVTVAVLKSGFVLLTRGPVAALLSLGGGLFSVFVMGLLLKQKRFEPSYLLVSMMGAFSHNMGQLVVASVLLKNLFVFYSAPVLAIAGILMGLLTGLLLKTVMPYLKTINKAFK